MSGVNWMGHFLSLPFCLPTLRRVMDKCVIAKHTDRHMTMFDLQSRVRQPCHFITVNVKS